MTSSLGRNIHVGLRLCDGLHGDHQLLLLGRNLRQGRLLNSLLELLLDAGLLEQSRLARLHLLLLRLIFELFLQVEEHF